MARDSLIKFSNAIINEAEEKKKQLLNKIRTENQELIKSKAAELERQTNDYIKAQTEILRENESIEISLQQKTSKTELIKKRNMLINSMFEKIEKNISEYTKTEEYKSRLKADFLKATELLKDNIIINARVCDIEYLKQYANENIVIKEADRNILGGFTAYSNSSRLLLDCTLKTRLEKEKKSFALKSGFIIE